MTPVINLTILRVVGFSRSCPSALRSFRTIDLHALHFFIYESPCENDPNMIIRNKYLLVNIVSTHEIGNSAFQANATIAKKGNIK